MAPGKWPYTDSTDHRYFKHGQTNSSAANQQVALYLKTGMTASPSGIVKFGPKCILRNLNSRPQSSPLAVENMFLLEQCMHAWLAGEDITPCMKVTVCKRSWFFGYFILSR
jgi:hypothetical protein